MVKSRIGDIVLQRFMNFRENRAGIRIVLNKWHWKTERYLFSPLQLYCILLIFRTMKSTALLACLFFLNSGLTAQTLTIHVANIRSSAGSLKIQFFTSAQSFDNEKPAFSRIVSKKDMFQGHLVLSLTDIKPGLYGVALLDDENNNQKMDYGLVLPKEGFGFSDYYHTGMSRPVFDKFDFIFGNGPKSVTIKIRYV